MFQSTHPRGVRRPQDGVGPAAGALVSIHAPAWGATFWGCKKPRCIPWFQSTHSRGVRLRVLVRAYSIQPFQSTHPRGVRQECVIPYISPIDGFNPRTRVGCDSMASYRPSMIFLFQSTHPRGVRPMRQATSDKEDAMFQSTHPRGVRRTRRRRQSRLSQCFNPRTRVGCDPPLSRKRLRCLCSFNPRTRVGCDDLVLVDVEQFHFVSIHAPAWGATPAQPAAGTTAGRFQSTHPRGVRLALIMGLASINKFQSTHPRGVRLLHAEGHIRDGPVSIHAPAWGATRDYFTTARPWPQFQSTHPRGVRHHDSEDIAVLFEVSIHAPAWGATIIRQSNKRGEGMFQSTHPRGVRRDYRTCS